MKKCKVPLDTLDETRNCKYDFSCLETGAYKGPEGCEVDSPFGENILLLKSSMYTHACPYRAHLNNNQLCLCPTKYSCFSQQQDKDEFFKECTTCQKTWGNYDDFLSDPGLSVVGYQASFGMLEAGLFLFNHTCNSTLAIPAENFTFLYDGPIFTERATGTDECPGHCLNENELGPCQAKCECSYVREILQIVKNWQKKY